MNDTGQEKNKTHGRYEREKQLVVQMRKKGFPSFLKLEDQKPNMLPVTPPRILHMPILGFRYNNANSATLKYFKTEKTGVVIRDIVPGGEFDRSPDERHYLVFGVV